MLIVRNQILYINKPQALIFGSEFLQKIRKLLVITVGINIEVGGLGTGIECEIDPSNLSPVDKH
jgi:hypothetical protein